MKKFVNFTLQKNPVLTNESRFLCAISGGQDSSASFLFLLHSLPFYKNLSSSISFPKTSFLESSPVLEPNKITHKNQIFVNGINPLFEKESPSPLELLYCQHFWQTKNFISSHFLFVVSYLFQIPFNINLPQGRLLKENRSRNWRKQNYCRVAQLQKNCIIVTGHTGTDSVERGLYTLIRGTSPKGFASRTFSNVKKTSQLFFANLILNPRWSSFFCFFELYQVPKIQKLFKQQTISPKSQKNFLLQKAKLYTWRKKPLNFHFCQAKNKNQKYTFFSTPFFFKNQSKQSNRFDFGKQRVPLRKIESSSFYFYSKPVRRQINYLRPLENIPRSTITKLIKNYHLPIVNDVTNFSIDFSRNQIRHQLIPLIRYLFHKNFDFLLKTFEESLLVQNRSLEKSTLDFLQSIKIVKKSFSCLCCLPLESYSKSLGSKNSRFVNSTGRTLKKLSVYNLFTQKECALHYALVQKLFSDYRDIELTFLQIEKIELILLIKEEI